MRIKIRIYCSTLKIVLQPLFQKSFAKNLPFTCIFPNHRKKRQDETTPTVKYVSIKNRPGENSGAEPLFTAWAAALG